MSATNKRGQTALCVAARLGHASVARLLLEQPKCDHAHLDPDGRHAMHWAAMAGHCKVRLRKYCNIIRTTCSYLPAPKTPVYK